MDGAMWAKMCIVDEGRQAQIFKAWPVGVCAIEGKLPAAKAFQMSIVNKHRSSLHLTRMWIVCISLSHVLWTFMPLSGYKTGPT